MALGRDGVSQVTPELLEAKREELGLNDPVRSSICAGRERYCREI